ncbi:Protein FAR1-related sequence 5 [Vitis vinifera]|uniref:Protein FAR1-related sequence 5 n=1 Tax=Vitis vinifera TaxID=29760 RepID=A0A438DK28_VITVI|nr:Protein FAR1-related sequence 5 [Vitis vinifera]
MKNVDQAFNNYSTIGFGATNDVGGEVVGNSVNMEGDQHGSFVEAIAQQGEDDNLDQYSSGREIVLGDEPYVGQEFDFEAAAYAFYKAYAKWVGFIIRASRLSRLKDHRSETRMMLVCTREGFRLCDKHESALENKEERKAGCKAKLVMKKMISGKWVVQKFIKKHNHTMAPIKGQRDLIYDQYLEKKLQEFFLVSSYLCWTVRATVRATVHACAITALAQHPNLEGSSVGSTLGLLPNGHQLSPSRSLEVYQDEHEKIRELTQSLAFEKRRAAAYKRYLTMVIGYIEEYNERMSKTMNKATENVGEIEVKEQENH